MYRSLSPEQIIATIETLNNRIRERFPNSAQDFADPAVLSTVNEVETLTTGLSRKVWQKIMIISTFDRPPVTP